ncbi:MAG: DUF1328 domain-containing protein, partial [Clostridiales bacterium]|nr:DUF1328 domain-containing protein [Clostridiales bacterium]
MRTKRQWLSILLVLSMVAGALGFGGVKSVSADNGKITNVQISKDYILTWDAVEGAETYTLQLPREWGSSKTNSFDIGAHFCKLGMPDGNYNVYITAYGKVNGETKSLAGSGFFYFDYVSPLPKLSTPQNIRLEGDELVWDPVKSMTDDEVKYKIDHRCIGGMSHAITETIKTTKTRIPVTEFTQHGTHDYEISIRAYAENHQDSDKGEKTISITRNLPALQNVDFTKGVLSWDEPEFDDLSYYIYVSSSGSAMGTNAPSIDYYNGRCYWDVSSCAKKYFGAEGMNVKVFIVGFEYVNELERVASVQTQAVNLDYVVQTEVYPLKFMGKQLSSADKVFNGYWIHYFPSINTLDFDNANLWAIQITGYPHEAVFESDQDLVIDGKSTLEWDKPMFKVNGQLTFAEESEMTINSGGYAVSADKILFNGKNLNVSAKNDDALFAKSAIKIGMTDQSVNVATTYGYSAFTCTKGKITLDRMHIETPEKGTLGKDAKHIYESDGRTAAEVVELVQATPTPTNSPKPTGATPKPTGATPKPTGATPKPTGATPKPTGATPKPTGATPKPTGATPKPTGATPKPTGATPKPTGATPKPTGATPKPTGATPKPTGATPKPTGATPKPTGA